MTFLTDRRRADVAKPALRAGFQGMDVAKGSSRLVNRQYPVAPGSKKQDNGKRNHENPGIQRSHWEPLPRALVRAVKNTFHGSILRIGPEPNSTSTEEPIGLHLLYTCAAFKRLSVGGLP